MTTRKRTALIAGGIALGLLISGLAGCGPKQEAAAPKKVAVLIDWVHEPTYLGVYYAVERGFFQKFGIVADIVEVQGANRAISAVANGQYLLSTASGGATALAFNQYQNVRSLGVIYPKVATTVYGIGTSIRRPQDLVGKRVGIYPGSINNSEFAAFLKKNQIDAKSVEVVAISGSDVALLVEGKIDAAVNYRELSPVQLALELERRGDKRGVFSLPLANYAELGYGLNLVSSTEALTKEASTVDAAARAIFLGYNEACRDQEDATQMFGARFKEFSAEYVRKSWSEVCNQIRFPVGGQTAAEWAQTIAVFRELDLLKAPVDTGDVLPARR